MQKRRLKILSLFLMMAILISSVGLSLNFHTCNVSGKKEVSFSDADFCCSPVSTDKQITDRIENGTTGVQDENCCEVKAEHVKLDSEAEKTSSVSILSFNFIFYVIYKFKFSEVLGHSFNNQDRDPDPTVSSIPHYGRYLLSLFQIFRI
jgi:hypothetical protein